MTALYELTKGMLALQDEPDMPEEAIRDTLEGMELEFNDKATAIIMLTQNVDGDVSAIDEEIKRLQQRKKVKQNFIDNLRNYLRDNMERSSIHKIEHALFTITLGKPSKVVEITGEVPDQYLIYTDPKPDKRAIAAALKAGDEVTGAELVDGKSRLIIK